MSNHRNDFEFDPIDEDSLFVPPEFDCEWPTAWDGHVTADADPVLEDELLGLADDVPRPRASLRDEFLLELGRVERSRERRRQLPVLAAFVAAALLGVLGPGHESPDAGSAVANNEVATSAAQFLPHDMGPKDLVAACREADSWALVDAYSNRRDRYRAHFRNGGHQSREE